MVQLRQATALKEADREMTEKLTTPLIRDIVALIPDDWLADPAFEGPDVQRRAYTDYLMTRPASKHDFVEEAINARA